MNASKIARLAQRRLVLLTLTTAVGCGTDASVATAPTGADVTAGDDVTAAGDSAAVPDDAAAAAVQDAGADVDASAVKDAGQDAGAVGDASAAMDATPDPTDAGATPDAGDPVPDAASAEDVVDGGWGPALCPVDGPPAGFGIGQTLGDLPVQDCDTGKMRTIKEVCGAKATWVFVAHSHCPTCRATATYTAQVAKQVADKGVAVVHVVQIDDSQTCPSWRKKYGLEGIENLHVYTDTTGIAWQSIKTSNYTAPHAFANGGRVITYKKHGLSSQAVMQKINEALASK